MMTREKMAIRKVILDRSFSASSSHHRNFSVSSSYHWSFFFFNPPSRFSSSSSSSSQIYGLINEEDKVHHRHWTGKYYREFELEQYVYWSERHGRVCVLVGIMSCTRRLTA
ncbi:hypothetical protein YC2023_060526 [Brassica napus]